MTFILVDGGLWRGPRPQSFNDVRNFNTVMSLEEGWFEIFHDQVGEESEWCHHVGVTLLHQPMSDIFPPTVSGIMMRLHLIKNCLGEGQKVLVHCLHGEDRTGIICAAYRIVYMGWPVEKAVAEMYAMGFHKVPYFYWVPVLSKLIPVKS